MLSITRVFTHRQGQPISSGCTDQWRTTNAHDADCFSGILHAAQCFNHELMWQAGLINNVCRPAIFIQPDRAVGRAVNFHLITIFVSRNKIVAPVSGISLYLPVQIFLRSVFHARFFLHEIMVVACSQDEDPGFKSWNKALDPARNDA